MKRAALLLSLISLSAIASCSVNEYCLNCAVNGDGGHDGGGDDANDGGDDVDASDAGPCVPSGVEVCDNLDNDCNGMKDDNIPGLGGACQNQMGECAGGVTQCVNGQETCTKPPMPEICDMKDNNCNGTPDEGDPGGGAACGTNAGECTAGVKHCNPINGMVECVGAIGTVGGQPETCNGRDDDCDGNFDEGLTNLGTCGASSMGACMLGTLQCQGGGTICVGDQGPTFEACDNVDNDCDGPIDEDYNKLTDPRNCMTCGHVCMAPNAISGCAGGNCTIAGCQPGFHNNNGTVADGCEYGPCQNNGAEVCDGIDNNCDGSVDNGLTAPPGLCKTVGACAGATASCMGAAGWKCNYGANVSTDGMGNIIAETKCDTIDNDCDTKFDENQPNKGQACADTGVGVCKRTGTFICDAANLNGPAVCNLTSPVVNPTTEICNGLDDDCNAVIDNGAAGGMLTGQDFVNLPAPSTVKIMKYEASRQNASATDQGTTTQFVCSRAGVVPWTNVKYPDARNACIAIGARLCTEAEWETMCSQPVALAYPVTAPTDATSHLVLEAELAQTNTGATSGGTARTWASVTTPVGFTGTAAMQALPDTGANVNETNALTQSPRLDFTVNFGATAANYTVWVHLYAINGNADTLWTAVNTTAPGTIVSGTNSRISAISNGSWHWQHANEVYNVSGNKVVSIYMREDGMIVDAISISRNASEAPTQGTIVNGYTWAYQSNTHTAAPQTCNDNEFDADLPPATAGDQDDILPTGSMAACFANGAGTNDAFDMSGNVKEWTNARAVGQNPIRGGASNTQVSGLTCDLDFTLGDDDFFFPNVGFRCCR